MQSSQANTYEYPLSETMRLCLKAEKLYESIRTQLQSDGSTNGHSVLHEVIWLLKLFERSDVKTRLMKWLVAYQTRAMSWQRSAQTDTFALREHLAQLDDLTQHLGEERLKFRMNQDPFLKAVELSDGSSGLVACQSPILQVWSHQPKHIWREQIKSWLGHVSAQIQVISFILKTLREANIMEHVNAVDGFYQKTLSDMRIQLIRVHLDTEGVYPQISVGKQRLSITFYRFSPTKQELTLQDHNTRPFSLACCGV